MTTNIRRQDVSKHSDKIPIEAIPDLFKRLSELTCDDNCNTTHEFNLFIKSNKNVCLVNLIDQGKCHKLDDDRMKYFYDYSNSMP